jgi:hypothetical protein
MIGKHDGCRLDEGTRTMSFLDAFFFSVETMATIGYGAPGDDIFFKECGGMAMLITMQTVFGLVLDGILLGLLLNRVSRGSPRSSSILFSDRAVMRCIRGRYHFMCQVGAASRNAWRWRQQCCRSRRSRRRRCCCCCCACGQP